MLVLGRVTDRTFWILLSEGKILKKNSFVTRMSSLGSPAKSCIKCYSMQSLWEAICFMSIQTKISYHCHEKTGEMSSFQLATWSLPDSILGSKVLPIILTFLISTNIMCKRIQSGKSTGKDSTWRRENILYEIISSVGTMIKFYQIRFRLIKGIFSEFSIMQETSLNFQNIIKSRCCARLQRFLRGIFTSKFKMLTWTTRQPPNLSCALQNKWYQNLYSVSGFYNL